MKTFFVVLIFYHLVNPAGAKEFTGSGLAVYNADNPGLSRLLATWDALADAMLKSGGEMDSQFTLQDELLKNQRLKISSYSKIELSSRECSNSARQITCYVKVNVRPEPLSPPQHETPEPCQNTGDGFEHCYLIDNVDHTKRMNLHSAKVRGKLVMRWKARGRIWNLHEEEISSLGIGLNEDQALRSSKQQLHFSVSKLHKSYWQKVSNYRCMLSLPLPANAHFTLTTYMELLGGRVLRDQRGSLLLFPQVLSQF